jgi:DNA polymerase elongation subunit (family B)
MRTHRARITVKNIILPYIEFKTATFQNLLKKFQEVVIYPGETKGGFKYSVQYKGVKTDYGLGGIHGARSTKVYESNEDMVIMTSDVTSFYPNLAIRNKWAPAHLEQDDFCDLYEWFFEERKKIPKKDPKNYVYKIILNSTYGLSNDENSFLYDPEFTMRITINGQLSLSMLYEMICEEIPNAVPLMQNTDGLETLIPREYVDKYMDICKRWEDITQLQLEHDTYSKIILGDVNNYIAITEDGKSKCKGRFEYDNLALHKNKSFLIIPKAIHAYFVDGIKPEDFLAQNQNIFDYCGGVKIKGDWSFYEHHIVNGEYEVKPLQHTIRYFVSKSGSKIIKKNNTDGREIQVEAGKWMQTTLINYTEKEFSEYDINYDYYLENIYKEIRNLEPIITQLKLF